MIHIATGILLDRDGDLLAYLRDNKPGIPFPNHWDLFGGYVEEGELPEEALVREIQEELGWNLTTYNHFRDYECLEGDIHENIKHVFVARLDVDMSKLTLQEGQELRAIPLEEVRRYKWANILERILNDFMQTKISP